MAHPKADARAERARERAAAAERQRKREQRITMGIIAAGLVVALAILGVVYWGSRPRATAKPESVGTGVADEGRGHVTEGNPIEYQHYPPTSGSHYPTPARWGTIGTPQQPLPEGRFIHNLEHGGIVVLYNCPGGCPDLVQQLQEVVTRTGPKDKYGDIKMVMTPYSRGMDHKIALLAWDYIDSFDAFDRDRIIRFYDAHVDRGPEDVR